MHTIYMFNQRINKINKHQFLFACMISKLKNSICYLLLLVFIALVSTCAVAQPDDMIDSLITSKKRV